MSLNPCGHCGCPDAAINHGAQAQYEQDLATIRCAPVCYADCVAPQVVCTAGTCGLATPGL